MRGIISGQGPCVSSPLAGPAQLAMACPLIDELQRELNLARRPRRAVLPRRGLIVPDVQAVTPEVRVVDHVEELRAELQLLAFRDPEVLKQRGINIQLARRAEGVAPYISVAPERRIGKSSRIEPVARVLV